MKVHEESLTVLEDGQSPNIRVSTCDLNDNGTRISKILSETGDGSHSIEDFHEEYPRIFTSHGERYLSLKSGHWIINSKNYCGCTTPSCICKIIIQTTSGERDRTLQGFHCYADLERRDSRDNINVINVMTDDLINRTRVNSTGESSEQLQNIVISSFEGCICLAKHPQNIPPDSDSAVTIKNLARKDLHHVQPVKASPSTNTPLQISDENLARSYAREDKHIMISSIAHCQLQYCNNSNSSQDIPFCELIYNDSNSAQDGRFCELMPERKASESPASVPENLTLQHKLDEAESRESATKSSSFSISMQRSSSQQSTAEPNASFRTLAGWWASVMTTFSAGVYLFDFVSTLLVVKQMYYLDYHPTRNREFSYGRVQGVFPTFLIIVGLANTANAIAFKLALPKEHQPIKSAYFLPLLQFQRLICGLWATGTCQNSLIFTPHLQETEALYAIMGASIEAAPQFMLQAMIFFQVGGMYTYYSSKFCTPTKHRWCVVGGKISVSPWRPSTIVEISILSSLASGVYNVGRAIRYQTMFLGCKLSYMLALISGLYTFGSLILRCSIFSTVVFIGNSNYRIHVDGNSSYSGPLDLRFTCFVVVGFLVPSILFALLLRPKRLPIMGNSFWYFGAIIMQAIVFGYVSFFLGPLYPLVRDACTRNKLKHDKFYMHLCFSLVAHVLLDVLSIIVSITSKSVNPCGPTLDNYSYIGPQPPLSATFTCTRFMVLTITGSTVSAISIFIFIILLKHNAKRLII